jgi:hypothetical protein
VQKFEMHPSKKCALKKYCGQLYSIGVFLLSWQGLFFSPVIKKSKPTRHLVLAAPVPSFNGPASVNNPVKSRLAAA